MKKIICLSVAVLALHFTYVGNVLAQGKQPDFKKETHVYKTADKIDVHADVYHPADDKVRPCVVWIHGGALINGHRGSVPGRLLKLCRDEGYALVSLDYRLAPEVKIASIIDDIKDAFKWLQSQGRKNLKIDTKRIVVTGGSAGGYLTMMAGCVVHPSPRGLVAYWGYGDVDGKWYTTPAQFYRKTRPLVKKADAYAAVNKGVITGSQGKQARARGSFYMYLRQNGLWTKVVTGFDPAKDRDKLTPFCPVRNITAKYPPILMIHGTIDKDVPYSLSADMAKELKKHGVAHRLITVQNAGHGLRGGDPDAINAAHEAALEFIRKRLQ